MLINTAIAIIILWTVVLTYFFIKLRKHYNNLISTTSADTLEKALDKILKNDEEFKNSLSVLRKDVDVINEKSVSYFKKIGFVRFNPFERMGGEQSFIIALLDGKDNGILLSFLYTREGVRVYAKRIIEAKGKDYELSSEEKEAIKGAK